MYSGERRRDMFPERILGEELWECGMIGQPQQVLSGVFTFFALTEDEIVVYIFSKLPFHVLIFA